MDLWKKNIHMDYEKSRTVIQTTIGDDINISDSKPDVSSIIFEKGDLFVDEVRASQDHVLLKGRLVFALLYSSAEGEKALYQMSGSVPFEEHVNMDGVTPQDSIEVQSAIEDLSISMINSRKISLRCLASFTLIADSLGDVEVPTDLSDYSNLEYRHRAKQLWKVSIMKKDVYRIKDEIEIPKNLPNIAEIVWEEVRPAWVDFRMLDGKIAVQGEVSVFFLYEGEGDDGPLRYYENTHSFSGSIPCQEASESMIPVISYRVTGQELSVRPDYDGEERVVSVDITLELDIKGYEEEQVNLLSDLYGVQQEIEAVRQKVSFKGLVTHNMLKQRLVERMKINADSSKIMQLMHSKASAVLDTCSVTDDGIYVEGSVAIRILYVSSEDENSYHSIKGDIPFSYTIDAPGVTADCTYNVIPAVEQINVVMVDSEEVDVKLLLNFQTTVFCNESEELITAITVNELDPERASAMPGIVIYVVKEGDNLWQIGKKYYVPVSKIKEMNDLTTDYLNAGDKILIVKEI